MTKFRQFLGYEFEKITNMQGWLTVFRLWVLVAVAGLASLHGGQGISARAGGAFFERQETGVFSFQTLLVEYGFNERGELVEFDPSLLRNGVYDLRLAGVTSVGAAGYSGERRVVIEGDLKVGHFALAFEDLSIPVKGLPLSVTRTYDSRFDGVGDFGRGWQLGVKGVEVLEAAVDAAGVNDFNLIGALPENCVYLQAVSGGEVVFKPVNGAWVEGLG